MNTPRLTQILLAVIAVSLLVQTALLLPLTTPVAAQDAAQEPRPRVRAIEPTYRSVVIDRYQDVSIAERSIQLRLMEGFEILSVQAMPESIGQLDTDDEIRVSNLFVAPINTVWVVVYGRP